MLVETHFKEPVKKLTPKERKEIRRQVYERVKGKCQVCGEFAPLYDEDRNFDVFACGHAAHIVNESQGGKYEVSNLEWKCYECHEGNGGEHGPRWSGGIK